jgi:hypothetical protein
VRDIPYGFLGGHTTIFFAQILRKGNNSLVEAIQYGFVSLYSSKRTVVPATWYKTHFKAWHDFRGEFNAHKRGYNKHRKEAQF